MNDFEAFAASGSTDLPLSGRGDAWDAGAARKSLKPEDFPKAHFWHDPSKPADEITAYKLPFARRTDGGLEAVWRGVTAAAQRLDQSSIPESDHPGIKTKIGAYYRKAAKQYGDDSIKTPWTLGDLAGQELFSAIMPLTHVEVCDASATGNGTWTMSGYAAVFNQQAVFLDSKWLRLKVQIAPTAFDRVFREQSFGQPDGVVHFNLGHDMNRAVAATDVPVGQAGSLELRADTHGLRYFARVSKDDPDAIAMATKMRDGVLKQASMAFVCSSDERTVTENADGPDEILRTILEVGHLYDVCACPQGAFPQTISQLQQYAAALGRPDPDREATRVSSDLEGAIPVATPRKWGRGARQRVLAHEERFRAGLR